MREAILRCAGHHIKRPTISRAYLSEQQNKKDALSMVILLARRPDGRGVWKSAQQVSPVACYWGSRCRALPPVGNASNSRC